LKKFADDLSDEKKTELKKYLADVFGEHLFCTLVYGGIYSGDVENLREKAKIIRKKIVNDITEGLA